VTWARAVHRSPRSAICQLPASARPSWSLRRRVRRKHPPYLRFLGLQGLIPLRDQSREMDNTGAGDIPAACPGTLPRTGSPKELQPPPPQPWPLSICLLRFGRISNGAADYTSAAGILTTTTKRARSVEPEYHPIEPDHVLVCTGPGDSCDEHGQLSSPLIARNRAGQRSSVPRSGSGMSSGLARLCSWLVMATCMGTGSGIGGC
jgi:hypothetical protein